MRNISPKISVIVPVYNVEKYLSYCIESILAQTYTNFELLLVDDGSKDQSGYICDEYAKKDGRIKVFHIKNSGVSVARNTGLNEATGMWVCFVDSDDWLDKDYLDGFNYDTSSDLLLQGFKRQYGQEVLKVSFEAEKYTGVRVVEKIVELERKEILIFRPPWAKLFKKKIIDDCCLKFDPAISIGEDFLFVLYYVLHTESVCISSKCGYNYRIISGSLTFKPYSMEKRIWISNEFYKIGSLLSEKYCYPKILEELMRSRVLGCLRNAYRKKCKIDERLSALEFYYKNQSNYGYKWLPMPYRFIRFLCFMSEPVQDKILMKIFFILNKMKKFQISTKR